MVAIIITCDQAIKAVPVAAAAVVVTMIDIMDKVDHTKDQKDPNTMTETLDMVTVVTVAAAMVAVHLHKEAIVVIEVEAAHTVKMISISDHGIRLIGTFNRSEKKD